MAFYHRINTKYFWLIPAIYFAIIGAIDIASDAVAHKLMWQNVLFNLALFIPLLINRKAIHIICGLISLAFSLYAGAFLFTCYIKYTQGAHFTYFFDTFVIGPLFVGSILLCSLSLIYAGTITSRKTAAA